MPCLYLIGLWFFNGSLNLSRAYPGGESCQEIFSFTFRKSGFEIIYVRSSRVVMQLEGNTKEF